MQEKKFTSLQVWSGSVYSTVVCCMLRGSWRLVSRDTAAHNLTDNCANFPMFYDYKLKLILKRSSSQCVLVSTVTSNFTQTTSCDWVIALFKEVYDWSIGTKHVHVWIVRAIYIPDHDGISCMYKQALNYVLFLPVAYVSSLIVLAETCKKPMVIFSFEVTALSIAVSITSWENCLCK